MVLLLFGDFLYEGILYLQVVVATQPEAGWVEFSLTEYELNQIPAL